MTTEERRQKLIEMAARLNEQQKSQRQSSSQQQTETQQPASSQRQTTRQAQTASGQGTRQQASSQASSDSGQQAQTLLMETDSGWLVPVPSDRLEQWQQAQKERKAGTRQLNSREQQAVAELVRRIRGSNGSAADS